jgi:SIR2-like domain
VPEGLELNCRRVMRAVLEGRVVPLFGAGANLSDRPAGTAWERGRYLPSSAELARHLAERFDYPDDEAHELVRISEYAYVMTGSGPLYEHLHEVFDADYTIGPLHGFLAGLPARLRLAGRPGVCPLILTTNYDDSLERAFLNAQEPFDVVSYMAEGEHRGRFVHWAPDAEPVVVERPNEYRGLRPEERTVILKMHGAVDRTGPDGPWDSYVITEDHYIEYLARTDLANLVPVTLAARLRRSHFLFLGYGMRDWNLRVILHRIWGEQKLKYKSWAVQLQPSELDREFWEQRGVDVLDVPLDDYVAALDAALGDLLAGRGES